MKAFEDTVLDPSSGWTVHAESNEIILPIFPEDGRCKVVLEPLLFGQFYLCVYRLEGGEWDLIGEKLPVRPGGPRSKRELEGV